MSDGTTERDLRADGSAWGCGSGPQGADAREYEPRVVTTGEKKEERHPERGAESRNWLEPCPRGGFADERLELVVGARHTKFIAHPIPNENVEPAVAHIDWLSFTVVPPKFKTHLWVMDELRRLLGFQQFTQKKGGLFGYEKSAVIEEAGLMAWGGKNQRGTILVSLNAQGCSRVRDWEVVKAWCECHKANITRADLAHDDLEGQSCSIEQAQAWYEDGGFNVGGRTPSTEVAGDWLGGKKGRTLYVGKRANGKLLRVYEKGKQLGDEQSRWVRVELELHNNGRHIPLDVLTRPGAYLAGAYKCLGFLSAVQCKIKTVNKSAKIAFNRAVEHARQQVGKLVSVMLLVYAGDYAAVVRDLARPGIPARLDPFSYTIKADPGFLTGDDDAPMVT